LPGHLIATHTAVDATVVNIYETITAASYYETPTDSGIEYTDEDGITTSIQTGYVQTITPVANVPFTITHGLGSTRIIVAAYDVTT
jgi:hypothetical protein